MPLSTPSITPAQIISALTALAASLIVIFKLDMTDAQRGAIVGAIGIVVPLVWQAADAVIRRSRAQAVADLALAQTPPLVVAPPTPKRAHHKKAAPKASA